VSEGSCVEAGTHRSECRETSIPSAVGMSGLQAGQDVKVYDSRPCRVLPLHKDARFCDTP
jgi:hypothetical protein